MDNIVEKLGLYIMHVGINAGGEEEAWALGREFEQKLGFAPRENGLSLMATNLIEIMKKDGPGTKGHIALGCNNLEESVAYLESNGLEVDETTTRRYDPTGALRVAFFKGEIGGFVFHLKETPKK